MSPEELAHAAVLEQMAHGGAYEGDNTGDVVSHGGEGVVDRRDMLAHAGYDTEPALIRGQDGMEMVVYRPAPGSDAQPVIAFRGSEVDHSAADLRNDFDAQQIGQEQYEANRTLIDNTMAELHQQYGQRCELTGHSLGGGLAQIAAAHYPEEAGHITTFQAPGMDRENAQRIASYNRERVAAGQQPLEADHFRVEDCIVDDGGEQMAPGTVHVAEIDFPGHDEGAESIVMDPVRAHRAFAVTSMALQSPEGRAALPGITVPEGQEDIEVVGTRNHEVDDEHPEFRPAEPLRRLVGHGLEAGLEAGDAAHQAGQARVDELQARVARSQAATNRDLDLTQRGADTVLRNGQQRTDARQARTQELLEGGNGLVDRAQDDLDGMITPLGQAGIDAGQRLVNGAAARGNRMIDGGQRRASEVVAGGQRAIDGAQRSVNGTIARGQRAVSSAQRQVSDVWDWIAD